MSGYFVLLSAGLAIISGLFIMYKGNWRPFGLKFAAVTLSTISSMVMLALAYQNRSILICSYDTVTCLSRDLCILVRNISILLFHIALGRDAIRYRNRDRRISGEQREREAA